MKSIQRGQRRLAGLTQELRRLRLAYARRLAHKVKVRGDLIARILAVKERIVRLREELRRRTRAA